MPSLAEQKAQLRKEMSRKRKTLGGPDYAQQVEARFFSSPTLQAFTKIAGYWPIAGELDICPLLGSLCQKGHICALPVVKKKDHPLCFLRWQTGDQLEAGDHGTQQPQFGAEAIEPDLALIPLLAFDRQGGRLGFGGGYYDRTLAAFKGMKAVGIAYDEQEVEAIPMDRFDQRMDWIVTPTRVIEV
ncbi:5-formyltetrahydrofolate cyclo-ligase [Terasakiella sp. SH-1]|uniref:5-formyltetrahydrofolate cyclo-ligase n=1 Tax=Terasakiella sp. SH-1 TaxID=2560057 RepID=UPI001073A1A3|nr:5-formyltetrahydrofolate cyclo-ligase [Terasakiella sp. SH-1]